MSSKSVHENDSSTLVPIPVRSSIPVLSTAIVTVRSENENRLHVTLIYSIFIGRARLR